MSKEYEAIKDRMAKLQEERALLLSLTDIVGSEKGLRENLRLINLAEEKHREIIRLNRKLLSLSC